MDDGDFAQLSYSARARSMGGRAGPTGPKAEQNRQAQAAYRQRQKARVAGLEEQVSELSQRVSKLEMERARYKAERDALSQCVGSISQGAAARDPAEEGEDIGEEAAGLMMRALQLLRGDAAAAAVGAARCRRPTVELLSSVCVDSMAKYRELVDAGAGVAGSAEEDQLRKVVMHMQKFLFGVWRTNTDFIHKTVARFIKLNGGQAAPAADLPLRVLNALNLMPDQEEAMIAAYRELMAKLSGIYAKHQALLSACAPSGSRTSSGDTSDRAPLTMVFQAMDEVSLELEATVMEKARAAQEFAITCYERILRPVQTARGHLTAFPHIMDTMAIAAILVSEHATSLEVGDDAVTLEMLNWLRNGVDSAEPAQHLNSGLLPHAMAAAEADAVSGSAAFSNTAAPQHPNGGTGGGPAYGDTISGSTAMNHPAAMPSYRGPSYADTISNSAAVGGATYGGPVFGDAISNGVAPVSSALGYPDLSRHAASSVGTVPYTASDPSTGMLLRHASSSSGFSGPFQLGPGFERVSTNAHDWQH